MMGTKQKLKTGAEEDVIYARKRYCYLRNSKKAVRNIKKGMRKRIRQEAKRELIYE